MKGASAACVLPRPERCLKPDGDSAAGECPWVCVSGADGCVSGVWLQLLAAAHWRYEGGIRWSLLRDPSQRDCDQSRVNMPFSDVWSVSGAASDPEADYSGGYVEGNAGWLTCYSADGWRTEGPTADSWPFQGFRVGKCLDAPGRMTCIVDHVLHRDALPHTLLHNY